MRHGKHHFQLGVKQAHRRSLMANLASQLFLHGKIKTTVAKAKALRPFAEKIITLAKSAALSEKVEVKLHFRRLAIARIRNEAAVKKLFDESVQQFLKRNGGYTRVYKLLSRVGDAAPMALIELVEAPAEKRRSSSKKSTTSKSKSKSVEKVAAPVEDVVSQEAVVEASAEKSENTDNK